MEFLLPHGTSDLLIEYRTAVIQLDPRSCKQHHRRCNHQQKQGTDQVNGSLGDTLLYPERILSRQIDGRIKQMQLRGPLHQYIRYLRHHINPDRTAVAIL